MRFLLAALMLIALSFSQFEKVDELLLVCEKGCCGSANYTWNATCDVNTSSRTQLGYTACENRCLEEAQGGISAMSPHPDFCFGPGLMLASVFASSIAGDRKKDRASEKHRRGAAS